MVTKCWALPPFGGEIVHGHSIINKYPEMDGGIDSFKKKKQLIFCTTARHPELETFRMDCLTQIKRSILHQTLNRADVV